MRTVRVWWIPARDVRVSAARDGVDYFSNFMSSLRSLSRVALEALADDLQTGTVQPPVSSFALRGRVAPPLDHIVAGELQGFLDAGMEPRHVAMMLRFLADERQATQLARDGVELVWTGPELPGMQSRDTAIVVREFFERATRSVLVSGFAFTRSRELFEPLARRMAEFPSLRVQLFMHVFRDAQDKGAEDIVVRRFVDRFLAHEWPDGARRPELYYDPRSLAIDPSHRASLHAKCVVIDQERSFVTSANFTEWAHDRNIEAGVVVVGAEFARALLSQFDALVSHGLLLRAATLA